MYSLIQFCTILILYSVREVNYDFRRSTAMHRKSISIHHFLFSLQRCSILGNFQFLYIDLVITASLAFTMGRQGPAKRLVAKRPSSSLISLANVIPLLLQVLSCVAVQIGALVYLHDQDWFYNSSFWDESSNCQINTTNVTNQTSGFVENILCWENTVLFLVSCYQYLILGAVYSKGLPHRQPLYTNRKSENAFESSISKTTGFLFFIQLDLLITFAVVLAAWTAYLLLQPSDFLADLFDIKAYNPNQTAVNQFRYMILLFPLLQLLLSVFIEVSNYHT